MHHRRVKTPSGVIHLLIIATIIAVVVFGLSAMNGGDIEPFQGGRSGCWSGSPLRRC
jgi:hypothetical protein